MAIGGDIINGEFKSKGRKVCEYFFKDCEDNEQDQVFSSPHIPNNRQWEAENREQYLVGSLYFLPSNFERVFLSSAWFISWELSIYCLHCCAGGLAHFRKRYHKMVISMTLRIEINSRSVKSVGKSKRCSPYKSGRPPLFLGGLSRE